RSAITEIFQMGVRVKRNTRLWFGTLLTVALGLLYPAAGKAQNRVLGQIDIHGKTKVDKTSGVWVDGQYVGFVDELKGDKKILLLPGDHEIDVRQDGYTPFAQKINVQPGKTTTLFVHLLRDPNAKYPHGATAEIKLKVTPDRAAVFVDGTYVGTPHEFGGLGRAMVIAPGKHHIRIALAGYQDFSTDVNLRAKQKITIKTDLLPGNQTGPTIKKNAD
ncbi:MAG TPA: PEGA domain-containing protein, partial [Terracidiphilus sp.]